MAENRASAQNEVLVLAVSAVNLGALEKVLNLLRPHFLQNEESGLLQHFSCHNMHRDHLGILSKCRFWFRKSGKDLRFCIAVKFPSDASQWAIL